MVPVIRSLVSFAAGIAHMPLGRFVVFTFLGSLPWTLLLVVAGVVMGANWEEIGGILKRFEYLARDSRHHRAALDLVPDRQAAAARQGGLTRGRGTSRRAAPSRRA